MTELSALHVRLTGDNSGLEAALNRAQTGLTGFAATAVRTQAQTSRLGGAMGMVAQRFNGARGSIQQVAFQLQDMAVQLQAGTAASVVFAQQGSQIASIFGPVGAIIGALAAVGIPALAFAFASGAQKADEMTAAMERQKEVSDALTEATTRLRLEREMMLSGAQFEAEQQAMNELVALQAERIRLQTEQNILQYQDVEGTSLSAAAKRAELGEQRRIVDARIAALNAQLKELQTQRQLTEGVKNAKLLSEAYEAVQNRIAAADISGPWQNVVGAIQVAIGKAHEYAQAMTIAQTGGGRGAGPGGPLVGSTDLAELQAGGGTFRTIPPAVAGGGGGGGGGGSALSSQLQSEIEAMQEALMTQEQLQAESFARQQEMLSQALAQRLITQEEYQNLMQQAQATHDFAMMQSVNKGVTDTLNALGSLFQGSKKIGAAVALANSWVAFTEVLKDPAYIGRPWARIAAAGQALAAGLNAVRNIRSASPGGAGGGGASGAGISQAPQQNVQTLNFTVTGDSFGIGSNLIRQIAMQLNQAQRNGSTLIRATVS